MALVELWWDIAQDETRRDSDRLEASKLLADRGWGKAAAFEPQEGDPLDLAALEGAAEEFRAKILAGCGAGSKPELSSGSRLAAVTGAVYAGGSRVAPCVAPRPFPLARLKPEAPLPGLSLVGRAGTEHACK